MLHTRQDLRYCPLLRGCHIAYACQSVEISESFDRNLRAVKRLDWNHLLNLHHRPRHRGDNDGGDGGSGRGRGRGRDHDRAHRKSLHSALALCCHLDTPHSLRIDHNSEGSWRAATGDTRSTPQLLAKGEI